MTSKAFCSANASTSTMTARAAGLRDHAGVVADLFLLRRDEQHVHAAARIGTGAGIENLVVEVDVLDVERDVLLRFPVDRLVQLRLGHHRQRDLLDDHRVAGERGADVLRLEGFVVLEDAADRVGDSAGIDDGAVDDRIRRHGLAAERRHTESLSGWLQFDGFDGARSDVEAHDGLGSTKHTLVFGVGLLSSYVRSTLRLAFVGDERALRAGGSSPKSGDRSPETGEGQDRNRNRCAINSASRFAGFPAQSMDAMLMVPHCSSEPRYKTVHDSHFCRAPCCCPAPDRFVIGIFRGRDTKAGLDQSLEKHSSCGTEKLALRDFVVYTSPPASTVCAAVARPTPAFKIRRRPWTASDPDHPLLPGVCW